MSDLRTSIVIDLTGNLERRAQRYGQALGRFSERGQRNLGRLARVANTVGRGLDRLTGRYTQMIGGVGAAYAGTRAIVQSGQLDKQLIQIRQTAGATAEMAAMLRTELHTLSQDTGQSLDSLLGGFNNLIQAGLSWDQALLTIKATAPAMAVTGAQAEILTGALTVAGEAFQFDLSQPKLAAELLDQMTVAGRLGNAELEDLSAIFARVGVNAKAANLGFSETLGFIEQLSMIEKQPERLATLADSTLRLFTNQKYMEKAAAATGVQFYDAAGQRRAAFDVLEDIAAKYRNIRGDQNRDQAIADAFGEADLDTIRGLRTLLTGDNIAKAREMSRAIQGGSGTIAKDLQDALANSVDQVARLKAALGDAADRFARPVNDAVKNAIKYLLDEKKLTGEEMLAGGAAAAAGGFALLKGGGALLQRVGGVGAGVAAGKALEEFAGVQPVYVVNMPGGGFPGVPGGASLPGAAAGAKTVSGMRAALAALFGAKSLTTIGGMGAGALGTAGLAVGGAGAAGYGVGTLINKGLFEGTEAGHQFGRFLNQIAAALGSEESKRALAAEKAEIESVLAAARARANPSKVSVALRVEADETLKTRVRGMRGDDGAEVEVDNGMGAATAW